MNDAFSVSDDKTTVNALAGNKQRQQSNLIAVGPHPTFSLPQHLLSATSRMMAQLSRWRLVSLSHPAKKLRRSSTFTLLPKTLLVLPSRFVCHHHLNFPVLNSEISPASIAKSSNKCYPLGTVDIAFEPLDHRQTRENLNGSSSVT